MRTRITVLLTVVLIAGVLAATAASANGPIPIDEIHEDTTLTEDHMGGIAIKEDGKTLDCDGYSIIENHESDEGVGILMEGLADVTVKNCRVIGFMHGVHLSQVSESVVKNTTVVAPAESYGASVEGFFGFFIGQDDYASHDNLFEGNSASGAEFGFYVTGSHHNTFKNNTATGSQDNGFGIHGGHYNTFINNHAKYTESHGFELVHATYNELIRNKSVHNAAGFQVGENSSHNVLRGNRAFHNDGSGFAMDSNANDNLFEANLSHHNSFGFIVSGESTANELFKNRAIQNEFGFYAMDYSPGTLLEANTLCQNSETDLFYDDYSEPILIDNRICDLEEGE